MTWTKSWIGQSTIDINIVVGSRWLSLELHMLVVGCDIEDSTRDRGVSDKEK